jgi:sigma-B regulation protein RsbU (phosphoserine phosphatase)
VGKKLTVLMIEDSEDDALLIADQLRSGGLEPVIQTVETSAEFLSALSTAAWDVILSDYSLPGLSGLQAVQMLRSKDPNTPFILVCGMIQDSQIQEVIQAGANAYVSKDQPSALVPTIERELRGRETAP